MSKNRGLSSRFPDLMVPSVVVFARQKVCGGGIMVCLQKLGTRPLLAWRGPAPAHLHRACSHLIAAQRQRRQE